MTDYTAEDYKDAARRAAADGKTDVARSLIRRAKALEASQTGVVEQAGSGVNEGLAATLGAPVDLMTGALNAGVRGINRVTGADLAPIEDPVGGSGTFEGILAPFISDTEPQNRTQELARRFGFEVGATTPFLPLGGPALGKTAAVTTTGNVGATAAGQIANENSDNPIVEELARVGGGILGAGIGARSIGALDRSSAQRGYVRGADSTEDLTAAATAKYEEGHALGLKIKPDATAQLDARVRGIATEAGLITPTGKVVENSDIRQVLSLLEDYQAGPVTTRQMQALRKQISAVAGNAQPNISRVGVQMKQAYDDFLGSFAPQFKEANELNRRAMLGDMMDKAEELADVRASQYSQSGTENALRTEFRQLDRNIAKGRTRGLRPDQVEAIQDVSRGTRATNRARFVGKLAPRGPISFGQHALPFALGSYLAGPAFGATLAGATASTGILAQGLATSLQRSAAARASAAMRQPRAMSVPKSSLRGILPLLAGQTATTERR